MRTNVEPLRLSQATALADARAAIDHVGGGLALVTSEGADVGVVTVGDLEHGAACGARTLEDVVSREIVTIDPRADLRRTVRAYRLAAWDSAIRRRTGRFAA